MEKEKYLLLYKNINTIHKRIPSLMKGSVLPFTLTKIQNSILEFAFNVRPKSDNDRTLAIRYVSSVIYRTPYRILSVHSTPKVFRIRIIMQKEFVIQLIENIKSEREQASFGRINGER